MKDFLKVEFHCHTVYSKDCLLPPEKLLEVCMKKKINRIVVTDHNTMAGALRAKELDPERVVLGEEILTTKGELLGVYMTEEIPPGLSPIETIARLRDQGAFISIAHPFDRMRKGHWEIVDLVEITPLVDAIETFNARSMWPGSNQQARDFAEEHGMLRTAGSDAHTGYELGKAAMFMPDFQDTESLRQSLAKALFNVSQSSLLIHFTSRYAVWRKKMQARKEARG